MDLSTAARLAAQLLRTTNSLPPGEPDVAVVSRGLVKRDGTIAFDPETGTLASPATVEELTGLLDDEVTRAGDAEDVLTAALADEVARAGAAEDVLTAALALLTTVQALTDAATVAWDMAAGRNATLTIADDRTLGLPTHLVAGARGKLTITQGSGGTHLLAYHASWLFAGGSDPVLSTAAGAKDVLSWYYDGTNLLASLEKAFA